LTNKKASTNANGTGRGYQSGKRHFGRAAPTPASLIAQAGSIVMGLPENVKEIKVRRQGNRIKMILNPFEPLMIIAGA